MTERNSWKCNGCGIEYSPDIQGCSCQVAVIRQHKLIESVKNLIDNLHNDSEIYKAYHNNIKRVIFDELSKYSCIDNQTDMSIISNTAANEYLKQFIGGEPNHAKV